MSIHKLKDPHAVKLALDEFDQLGRTAFLEKYGFGRSREYMLRDPVTGNLYDSKAIVGAAYGYAFPDKGPLGADSFSGGEATVERVLSDLDFEVVRVGQEWNRAEVEATVRDYFEMLSLEAQRIHITKASTMLVFVRTSRSEVKRPLNLNTKTFRRSCISSTSHTSQDINRARICRSCCARWCSSLSRPVKVRCRGFSTT